MSDADKVRFLAELAGWTLLDPEYPVTGRWVRQSGTWREKGYLPDYPHSLDAIARDLLPLLREKGWEHELTWDGEDYSFFVWNNELWNSANKEINGVCRSSPEPARAAFEAIFEALHGGEE